MIRDGLGWLLLAIGVSGLGISFFVIRLARRAFGGGSRDAALREANRGR